MTAWTFSGHRSEFCARPDGTVTSAHDFAVVPGTIRREHDFEYAVAACWCGQTLTASRPSPATCDDCGGRVHAQRTVDGGCVWSHTGGGQFLHFATVDGTTLAGGSA